MTISPTGTEELLPEDRSPSGSITRVGEELLAEAVHRLVATGSGSDREHARRFLRFAREGGIDLDAMWAALDDNGRVRCTALAVPNPGRTAMLFTSPLGRDDAQPVLARLIDHVCGELARRPEGDGAVHLVQVLLDPGDTRQAAPLLDAGFTELARLSYLERGLPGPRTPAPVEWPSGVSVATAAEAPRGDLLRVLEESYEDTLDCPGLRGLRRTEDILEGHRATGEYVPDLWTLLSIEGRPAGVVLLNPSSQGRCVELVYLGLAPFARGRGLGRRLLRYGLGGLRGRRERAVTLAVDENNAPALGLYHAEGFRRVLRRVALIRPLRPHRAEDESPAPSSP